MVKYLGHKVNEVGIHPTTDKIKTIREAPQSRDVTEIKSLGFSVTISFSPTCQQSPLYMLLIHQNRWMWSNEQQKVFEQAKLAQQLDTLLVHYDSEKELTLSSNIGGSGGMLPRELF